MSKGSARRPATVAERVVAENWDRIFGDKQCGTTSSTSSVTSSDTLKA